MEKKKLDTKAILERSRKAKEKHTDKNFSKIVGKKANKDRFRKMNFSE